MSSLQAKIVRKSAVDPKHHRDVEKENLQMAKVTADKVVSEVFQMALTRMLVEAEEGRNSQKIMDTLRTLELDPDLTSNSFDVTLWKSNLDTKSPQSQSTSEKLQPSSTSSSVRGGASTTDKTKSTTASSRTGTSQESGRTKTNSGSKPTTTIRNKDEYITRL